MRTLVTIILLFSVFACQNQNGQIASNTDSEDKTEIHFTLAGKGAPVIVLVHGWCIDQTYWAETVDSLKGSYEVLSIDLAGHGMSDTTRVDYTVEAYAADVLGAMDATNITEAILVGHSMAGSIILEVNRQAPERVIGLIGIDNFKELGVVYTDSLMEGYAQAMANMKQDYEGFNRNYVDHFLFPEDADTAAKARVLASILSTNHRVATNTLENLLKYGPKERPHTQALTKKLHLIQSDYTPSDTAALAEHCGGGYQIYPITGIGHYPMIEAPGDFTRQLISAIANIQTENKR